MRVKPRPLLLGIITYIPGLANFHSKGTGGTNSARYCYSVWLRHLVMAHRNRLCTGIPKVVAELGPGDSIGIGLAALISGTEVYYGLDIVEHATLRRNLTIFDELVDLFRRKENIPDEKEFPDVKPYLDSYEFPSQILTDDRLFASLMEKRIEQIRNSVVNFNSDTSLIKYVTPWFRPDIIQQGFVDMVYSQAVLEHVSDLHDTYKAIYLWLKSNGFVSHQIDFKCHGTADDWNGHWTYSDFTWKLIRGRRPYLLNREPHSTHIKLLEEAGFKIECDERIKTPSKICHEHLAPHFRNMSAEDLTTSGAFIQATKR